MSHENGVLSLCNLVVPLPQAQLPSTTCRTCAPGFCVCVRQWMCTHRSGPVLPRTSALGRPSRLSRSPPPTSRRERAPSGHRCDACATRAPSDRRVPHAAYPALSRKRYLSLPPSPRARRNAVTEVGSRSLPSKREKAKRVEWAVGTSYMLALPSIAPSAMALVTMWPDEG